LASLAYERLSRLGYRNLRVLDEGIPGWIEQGHPTEGRRVAEPFAPHPYEVPGIAVMRPSGAPGVSQ
jgi:3-mercaptopyruvate sulfurtransferase SseA